MVNFLMRSWLWFLLLGTIARTLAINRCSHSMSFRDFCPNPMSVSADSSTISLPNNAETFISINLTRQNDWTCDFYKSDREVTTVGGIHIMENAWQFSNASNCNHTVKLVLDRETYMLGKHNICHKELGMKVHENVYIWHNFSLTSNQFSYIDLIKNYGHSHFDLQCTHSPKFVLILFESLRDSKCSLLVQQYRISDRGNNCGYIKTPQSKEFCGAYPCSHFNLILHELKLIARRIPINMNENIEHSSTSVSNEEHVQGGSGISNPTLIQEGSVSTGKESQIYGKNPLTTTDYPVSTISGTIGDPKPVDWVEWIVRLFFPAIGIGFIFLLLTILKGRYVNELCGRQGHCSNQYLGSNISMEKQGLNM